MNSNSFDPSTPDIMQELSIVDSPKLKGLKKIRRDMPFDSSALDNVLNQTTYLASEINLLEEDRNIRHLAGKYERYFWDGKLVIRDILIIRTNGNVTIKSPRGILSGTANYSLNSVLTIRIDTFNDTPFFEQLSCFVGRYAIGEINCLFMMVQSINANNVPFSRQDLLIPVQEDDGTIQPEMFTPQMLNFFKLEKRYPDLIKNIQARTMNTHGRVDW